MSRPVDVKTQTLYVYVKPVNRDYVKKMKPVFRSESNYIDELIDKDRRHESLKKLKLKEAARKV